MTNNDLYNQLSYYTLSHKAKEFIHQHVVDAFTAQTANEKTKAIAIFFALAGLHLLIEKKLTGRQVQKAHLFMASKTKIFPEIILPADRGKITIENVLNAEPGVERDKMIHDWCASVWPAYSAERDKVISSAEKMLIGFYP